MAGEMEVKVEGPWNTAKYWWSLWLGDKKTLFILDAPE